MYLFIEGPDGGGKTNLSKRLSELYQYPIVKFSYPKNEDEKKHMFEMYADLIYKTGNAIVDRCWYSDMVYSPIMRNEPSPITKLKMYELEKLVLSQGGGQIIHCTDKVQKLYERVKSRGDDYIPVNLSTISTLKRDYESLFHVVPHLLPVLRYSINENVPKL